MVGMFYNAISFNQLINTKVVNKGQENEYTAWNVSNVIDMDFMFDGAINFNVEENARWYNP